MRKEISISPKQLALTLDVPVYLFSDLPSIRGELLADGLVEINDSATPALNGILLEGVISKCGLTYNSCQLYPFRRMV